MNRGCGGKTSRAAALACGALLAVTCLLGEPARAAQSSPPAPKEAMRAFDEVIKDAEKVAGVFTFYRTPKNDLWLEVTPEMLRQTYFLEVTAATGLGGFAGGATVGDPLHDVVFTLKRVREQVFVVARQTRFRARAGDPIEKSVQRSFADSILAALPAVSAPHPGRKSVLVDATGLFFADLPACAAQLSARLRSAFTLDPEKSYIDQVKAFPENAEVEVACSFTAPQAAPSDTLADGRSAPVRIRYSFVALKDNGYTPRLYDGRVGYFVTAFRDLTDDNPDEEFTRYILRWNLEKKDPCAPLSPPRKPLVFWLDNAIPHRYRTAVANGVLLWNKAFERVGIQNAIEVRQIERDADIDPFDARYNVLRWATSPGDGYAIALVRANPLTGEILHASIRVDASIVGFTRQALRWEDELKGFTGAAPLPAGEAVPRCEYGRAGLQQAAFGMTALDLMALQGGGLPVAERERYTEEFLTQIIAHEMGHVLGLRHNFKGSTLHATHDLHDAEKTARSGVAASVMDYNPANLAPARARQGPYYNTTLGAYDLWAIEYGYTRWPNLGTPQAEKPALLGIACRAAEPALAYATDEDVSDFGWAPFATDPLAGRWDLGADPLAYARQRGEMIQALYAKLEARSPRPGESYADTRRKFRLLLGEHLRTFYTAGKYIGGLYFTRARRGDARAPAAPFTPVPAAKQREALLYLRTGLFNADAFRFPPSLLNKLADDKNIHWGMNSFGAQMEYSVTDQVRGTQRALLAWLFTPGLLARLRDNEARVARPADTLTLPELFEGVTGAVFSELRGAGTPPLVPTLRRDLQHDYVALLANLCQGDPGAPSDAQSLSRFHLRRVDSQITAALGHGPAATDVATRAHLEQLRETVRHALKAPLQPPTLMTP